MRQSDANPLIVGDNWPSKGVGRLLIDVFLTRIYNASLLFHRKTLLEEYESSRVPEHVSLSIFALASLYVETSYILDFLISNLLNYLQLLPRRVGGTPHAGRQHI